MAQLHAEATGSIRLPGSAAGGFVALAQQTARAVAKAVTAQGLVWVMEFPTISPRSLSTHAPGAGRRRSDQQRRKIHRQRWGGRVGHPANTQVRIAIADTGPGIAADEQTRVFDPLHYRGRITATHD